MKIETGNQKVWQIGSGDGSRGYSQVFFDLGVALVGPGDPGREGEEKTAEYYRLHPEAKNWGAKLKKTKPGDWIILRKGRREILGIGKIAGAYNYSSLFEDVDGWDLQHYAEVEWYRPLERIEFESIPLSMNTLASCNHPEVLERIQAIEFEKVQRKATVAEKEANLPAPIEIKELAPALIEHGLRIQDAEGITQTIERVIRLAKWYYKNDYRVSEHELRTFMVIPLLIALGWSEQKIKIEFSNIDAALFKMPFTASKIKELSPEIILETKVFNDGLAFTGNQLKTYGKKFPDCRKFIATNGFRYKFFHKEGEAFVQKGYLNLFNLRKGDVFNNEVKGAIDTLLMMSGFVIT
jgi:hypothetical protein